MKVLLVNGGPHPKGCTNRALEEVEKALKEEGIETLIYHIPNVPYKIVLLVIHVRRQENVFLMIVLMNL